MKNRLSFLLLVLTCVLWLTPARAHGPLRVICVESGGIDYNYHMLQGFIQELYKRKFLLSLPNKGEAHNNTSEFWEWLAQNSNRQKIIFQPDGFYTFDWDDDKRKEVNQVIQKRIQNNHDVDFILALGTPAGIDMSQLKVSIPVLVAGVTNAVEAGIVPSVDDSGQDNLLAIVEPQHYRQQLGYFHHILPFTRLGITYEDSPSGRSMVALSEIEDAAEDLGFTLVRCVTHLYEDPDLVEAHLKTCHQKFIDEHVDAVYLTYTAALSPKKKRRLLLPLINAGIHIFSQTPTKDVKCGALLSFVDSSFSEGQFAANILVKVAEGAKIRSLSQRFQSPKHLVINLRTAASLGWDPSLEILLSVDKFYE